MTKAYGVSDTTIKRLVASGLLPMDQIAPSEPWEIRSSELEAEPIRGILDRLRRTGKLVLRGGVEPAAIHVFNNHGHLRRPSIMRGRSD